MATITSYANRHSRALLPEIRVKLARAKDELRGLFGRPHAGKGTGGPGAKRHKPKAHSRRSPRPPAERTPKRGSRRAVVHERVE
jgi:hypothetical protein